MRLDYLCPMLWTNDMEKSISFYTDVLGFELDEYNKEWAWCHMHKDKVSFMFTSPNEHTPYNSQPVLTGSFYIYTEAVDEIWEHLKDKATVSYGIANFPHNMREFAILDNNGYMLQFGRELKSGEVIDETNLRP